MKHRRAADQSVAVRIGRERRIRTRLAVAAPAVVLAIVLLGVAPAQQVLAQQNSGGTITIGGSIADAVAGAVSSVATGSGGSASGGVSVERTEDSFGEDEAVAISDASGGNHNVSANRE